MLVGAIQVLPSIDAFARVDHSMGETVGPSNTSEVVSPGVNPIRANDPATAIDRSTPAGESSHRMAFDWVDPKVIGYFS